jgi:membrane-associated protease RseP (regulator of RpoE activity)
VLFRSIGKNSTVILAFEDAPAIKAGLIGAITEFDGKKIKTNSELGKIIRQKIPGTEVKIKTFFNNSFKEYNIRLSSRPDNKTQAYLGIGTKNYESTSFIGKIRNKLLFFKEPSTYYKAKQPEELIIFIYNLIWWLVIINLSVALGNMLPLGIFDGGRFFYLTILSITKSEKIAQGAYKISTYIFIGIFVLLTALWLYGFK